MFRTVTTRQLVADIGFAVACVLFEVALISTGSVTASFFALAGMGTALALRRLSPGLSLGIAWLTALLQMTFLVGADISNLAILAILYSTARYGAAPVKWAGLISAGAGALLAAGYIALQTVGFFTPFPDAQLLSLLPKATVWFLFLFFAVLVAFVLSWTFGLLAKTWRTARDSGTARILAERQSLDARHSVVVEQERNRIARDMHDVVAHSLAVVIAQADGARYAQKSDPDAVDTALTTISATAREALGDVRILLGQLRHNQSDAPQPVLADLDRLVDQVRGSGLPVRLERIGEPEVVGTGTQLAIYRIVQEALTNALRHGDTSQDATVTLHWRNRDLTVVVDSALRVSEPDEGGGRAVGHGISGMAERAMLVGGTLSSGPHAGRFVVTVVIPLAVSEPLSVAELEETR